MSNPLLNESTFEKMRERHAGEAGWAAASGQPAGSWAPPTGTPINDGPTTKYHGGVMTVSGTASASLVLFAVLLISAAVGWMAVAEPQPGVLSFPMMAFVGAIVGFIAAIASAFKPLWSHILGPVYAVGQGLFVGAISKMFNAQYSGIVLQAVGTTLAVFGVMLFLYRTRVIRVTNRFRRIVIGATLGLVVFYLPSATWLTVGVATDERSEQRLPVAQLGEQTQDLEIQPDDRHEQAERSKPFHAAWQCHLLTLFDEIEVKREVEGRQTSDEQAEEDAE
ncbi:MAG: Bax inhibitor-1/YccA family protein [Acidimicrobiia bacterium]|nr:Bax inhibitor-1/YccA family protein [Acidimicrobiia bacterium]